MSQTAINDFSLLCRLFGNLWYRQPTEAILAPTFLWLQQGGLTQHWALATDAQSEHALTVLEKSANPTSLLPAYQALFGEQAAVSPYLSAYTDAKAQFIALLAELGMSESMQQDHVASLLLAASWIEDHALPTQAQQRLFEHFLLPVMGRFLGKVEAFDTGFYKALAQLTREALSAMADELEEAV